MFTGIIEELGEVVALERGADDARLVVAGPRVAADAGHGDSIAVNGVCLTVAELGREGVFAADVMAETLHRSNLGALSPGDRVNLERPVTMGTRLGGHLVQGHVDGVGAVLQRLPGQRWVVVRISLPPQLARYVVEKGSITVDGTSLTVASVDSSDTQASFTVSLIPTTLEATTLGTAAVGAAVNVEVDVIAKHVERLLAGRA